MKVKLKWINAEADLADAVQLASEFRDKLLFIINLVNENRGVLRLIRKSNDQEERDGFFRTASDVFNIYEAEIHDNGSLYASYILGKLAGEIERDQAVLSGEKAAQTQRRIYEEYQNEENLNAIILALGEYGLLSQKMLGEMVRKEKSTLSMELKKYSNSDLFTSRRAGRMQLYSLTDLGVGYYEYLEKREQLMKAFRSEYSIFQEITERRKKEEENAEKGGEKDSNVNKLLNWVLDEDNKEATFTVADAGEDRSEVHLRSSAEGAGADHGMEDIRKHVSVRLRSFLNKKELQSLNDSAHLNGRTDITILKTDSQKRIPDRYDEKVLGLKEN